MTIVKYPDRILVVDDEPLISDIIAKSLESEGYECEIADSAEEALELLKHNSFSLLMSDINLPGKTGIELLSIVKQKYRDIAVIMVTAVDDRKTAIKALQLGAYGFVIKPFDINEIAIGAVNALERRKLSLQSKEYENRLENDVRNRTSEIHRREEEICLRLTSACEYRDVETGSHNRRLGLYASLMAHELGLEKQSIEEIRIAASMHDIGKIAVPDKILLKEGSLNDREFKVMKQHTIIGAEILDGSEISLLNMAKVIALHHHERWDGAGYPNQLAGKKIPIFARLVAVIDVYDALVHKRVYRPPIPEDKAIQMISSNSGTHFDPEIFGIFIKILPRLRAIRLQLQDKNE